MLCCGGVSIVLGCGIIGSDVREIHLLGRETHSLSSLCGSLRFEGGHEDWREDSTTSLSNSSGRKHESSFTKQSPNTLLRITYGVIMISVLSVSNMPLRVSSGISAQMKHLNGSMRIGATISTVRACSKVESSSCRRSDANVSQALHSPCEALPKAPDTETRQVTTEILLHMHSA